MSVRFLRLCAALLAAPFLACVPAAAQTAVTPATAAPAVDSFFQYPSFSSAALSPDGSQVAMLLSAKGGNTMLAVMDMEKRVPRVLVNAKSDVASFRWVNDQRLVFSMTDRDQGVGDSAGGPGIFAINADGSGFKELAERRRLAKGDTVRFQKDVLPYYSFLAPQAGLQDSNIVHVMQRTHYRDLGYSVALLRLDTVTGKAEPVKRPVSGGDAKVTNWLLDETGEARLAGVHLAGRMQLHYREPGTDNWRQVTEYDPLSADAITPYGFAPDGRLYVLSRRGQDKAALYAYDIKTATLADKPLVNMPDYDFRGALVMQGETLTGVRYVLDAPGTHWLDAKRQAIQAAVDKRLPATINTLYFPRRGNSQWLLVHAMSDAQPGQTWLYNSATGLLELLGEAQPDIDPRQMARTAMVRYTARDGLSIPAYLTLPRGAPKNAPLVVLVHGGPFLRGATGMFDPEVQFLASRGYAVLRPEFRGSAGFGARHLQAGFKQWGQAMQDDLEDGVKWAAAQGYADPQRVCIVGASYGGYAALMGLVRHPSTYRCAVAMAAVSDINLMYDVSWSDIDDVAKNYGMPALIGDREKDAAMLKANSPLEQADRIRQPLLLAYGGSDRRVPKVHGTRLRDAVAPHNAQVEWIEYPEEGHGWLVVKNRIDYWSRVARFLDQHTAAK